ncbi:MAG: nucleotidyltransferase family protein [Candidatus Ranarchaeia archaeon]
MLTKEEILQTLKKNRSRIREFGVLHLGLFGSYIRGAPTSTGDLDILVVFDHAKKTFDNYMELKFFLEDLFKTKVDLVIKEAIKPALRSYILGEVVYAT